MTDPIAARAAFASDVARRAGALALDYYRNRASLEIETKAGDLDPVSIADRSVEEMIRAEIEQRFPDDGVLGEEGGMTEGRSGLTWIIDPIDGTVPFLIGQPSWCVVISLAEGPETRLGVINVPVTEEQFTAREGHGAALNGVPLKIDPARRITQGLVAVSASERCEPAVVGGIVRRLMDSGGMFYRNGSGANMLASVAAGRLVGYVEPAMNPWDCLAGLLMIREAGGVSHPFPADARLGLVMGAAPGVWDDLHSIVSAEFPGGLPAPLG